MGTYLFPISETKYPARDQNAQPEAAASKSGQDSAKSRSQPMTDGGPPPRGQNRGPVDTSLFAKPGSDVSSNAIPKATFNPNCAAASNPSESPGESESLSQTLEKSPRGEPAERPDHATEIDILVSSLNEKNQAMYDLEAKIISCAGLTAEQPPLDLQADNDEVGNWKTLLKFRYELGKAINQLPATAPANEAHPHSTMRDCLEKLDKQYAEYSQQFEEVRKYDPDAYHAAKAISAIYTMASTALAEVHPEESSDVGALIDQMANAFADGPDKEKQQSTENSPMGTYHAGRMPGALTALQLACSVIGNGELRNKINAFDDQWREAHKKSGAERDAACMEAHQTLESLLDEMVNKAKQMAIAAQQAGAAPGQLDIPPVEPTDQAGLKTEPDSTKA